MCNNIPDISNLAIKTALITVENKIPSVSNLAAKTLVNKVENIIPNIINLLVVLLKKGIITQKLLRLEIILKKLQTYDLSYFRG